MVWVSAYGLMVKHAPSGAYPHHRRRWRTYYPNTTLHCQAHTYYSITLETTPAPTVRPPSRIAKRNPSSIAIGAIKFTVSDTLSPGITISVPAGNSTFPV